MTQKSSFILYHSLESQLDILNDEQAGRLIKAVFAYAVHGEDISPDEDALVRMCYSFVVNQMKIDAQKYEQTCVKNKENGKKGGRPKKQEFTCESEKTEGFFKKPKKADNEYDTEYDTDTDTDTDTEYDTDTDSEYEKGNVNDKGGEYGYEKDNDAQNIPTDQPPLQKSFESSKKNYASAVRLTDEQYGLLVKAYGEYETRTLIDLLNEYKISNNKEYNSDYHAITAWVVHKRARLKDKELSESHSSMTGFDLSSLIEKGASH